jgi:hypothetical protein
MDLTVSGSEFEKMPYVDFIPRDGRIISLQPFYSEEMSRFRLSVPYNNKKLIEMKTGGHPPTQSSYWSKKIVDSKNDLYIQLLYNITNQLSYPELMSISIAIQRDIYNFATFIPKQIALFEYCKNHCDPIVEIYNVFEIELEYLMGLIRSFYGLLHDILRKLFEIYKLPKQLPDSLGSISDMGLEKAKITYDLKQPIIEYLEMILPLFAVCRTVRDDIYHRGKDTGIIFCTDYGPGMSIENRPLNKFGDFLQDDSVYQGNKIESNIGSLFYFMNKLIKFALAASDLLTMTIKAVFDLPQEISSEYKLFLIGPDLKHLNGLDIHLAKCWIKPLIRNE